MEHGVMGDLMDPILELAGGGQLAEQDQVGDFEEGAMLGQHFDGITAVAQNAPIAINVGDRAPAGGGVHEGRVIGHQAEVFRASLDLAQVHGADGAVFDWQGIGLAGTVIGDSDGVLRHRGTSREHRRRQGLGPGTNSPDHDISDARTTAR
jgi:hypothetical protein